MSEPPEDAKGRRPVETPPPVDEKIAAKRPLAEEGDVNLPELAEPGELVRFMDKRDVRAWQIRRAALLAILNIETRSFEEISLSLGVGRAAISKVYTQLCYKLGYASLFKKLETRKKYSEAAHRNWRKKKQESA